MTLPIAKRRPWLRVVAAIVSVLVWSLVMSEPLVSRLEAMLPAIKMKYGAGAAERIKKWEVIIAAGSTVSEPEKLRLANLFFNSLPNVDDRVQWGQEDYWATPLELLISNGGDCEDFAMAKYFTLRELGVPDERLRITYVKAFLPRSGKIESHMVLTYYPTPDAEPLILDNLRNSILPASSRPDLLPSYSFNGLSLWSAKRRGQGEGAGELDGMEPSGHLEARMQQMKAGTLAKNNEGGKTGEGP